MVKRDSNRKYQMNCTQLHEAKYLKNSGLNKEKLCFFHAMKSLEVSRRSGPGVGIQKNLLGTWAPFVFVLADTFVKMGTRWLFYVQALCSPSTGKKTKRKSCRVHFVFVRKIIAFAEAPPSRLLFTCH